LSPPAAAGAGSPPAWATKGKVARRTTGEHASWRIVAGPYPRFLYAFRSSMALPFLPLSFFSGLSRRVWAAANRWRQRMSAATVHADDRRGGEFRPARRPGRTGQMSRRDSPGQDAGVGSDSPGFCLWPDRALAASCVLLWAMPMPAQELGSVPRHAPTQRAPKGEVLEWTSAQGRPYWYRLPKKNP